MGGIIICQVRLQSSVMRAEDELKTLTQILEKQFPIAKACTMGIIIDVSAQVKDQQRQLYIKRIKIVDHTFNFHSFNPFIHSKYLTVFFQADHSSDFPSPRCIGDVIYLKRFKFKLYNNQLQAYSYNHAFCAWYLLNGDINLEQLVVYGTSRKTSQFKEEQYEDILGRLKDLKKFSRNYLSNQSIMAIVPSGTTTKDRDYVVQVIKWSPEGYLLILDTEQVFLPYLLSQVNVPCLAKLKSIVRIQLKHGRKEAVCTRYTSLTQIYDWSYDAKICQKVKERGFEDQGYVSTRFSELLDRRIPRRNGEFFQIRVAIADLTPASFLEAIRYYDPMSNTQSPKPEDNQSSFQIVYKVTLICLEQDYEGSKDESSFLGFPDQKQEKQVNLYQIFLFSEAGKGGNFVEKINLSDLGPFTSFEQQQMLYRQRRQQLLNAREVKMKVQLLQNQQADRILKLIDILQLYY